MQLNPGFDSHGNGTHHQVPTFVAASWERCIENYHLEPHSLSRPGMLTHQELRSTLESCEGVVRFAEKDVEKLFQRLVDDEYMVSLASAEGTMLLFRCDHLFLGEMNSVGVIPGSIWREETQGTNGIGTCLKVGKALSIIGEQHFDRKNQNLTCTVAPIFGRNGTIQAVLNVTACRPVSTETARVVSSVLQRAANRIENRCFERDNSGTYVLLVAQEGEFADMADEARLAVDVNGRIVDLTSHAPLLLGKSRDQLIGKEIDTLVAFRERLDEGRVTRGELVTDSRRQIFATLTPPKSSLANRHRGVQYSQWTSAGVQQAQKIVPAADERILLHSRTLEQLAAAERMANGGLPLIVQGETGVGKTTFARMLGGRCRPESSDVTVVNFSAIRHSRDLSNLSSVSDCTLIFDNVDEATTPTQSAILDYLSDDREMQRRGITLVSATTADLSDKVKQGKFRPDLYHRLCGGTLSLEPLRASPSMENLIKMVFEQEAAAVGMTEFNLEENARLILVNHHWPGNIRELRHTARHAVLLSNGAVISIGDLPPRMVDEIGRENISARSQSEISRIQAALKHNGGNVTETARYLGVSRATLYRKLQIKEFRHHYNSD